jgi:rod shape-determining protein MreB
MSAELALDLGSANTRVVDPQGNVLLDEPTVAAVDADSGRLVAFGEEAYALSASSAGRVSAVRPVRRGQLADLELADAVLAEVLRRSGAGRWARPRVLTCVSSEATPVQLRALERSLRRSGARAVRFVEIPVACAAGAGLPVEEPAGCMVVDVGAGTTEVGILALGGVVASTVLGIGGEDLDEAVGRLLVQRYDLHVDRRTLEAVRIALGTVAPARSLAGRGAEAAGEAGSRAFEVPGRRRSSGEPCVVLVDSDELRPVLERPLRQIVEAALATIVKAPPDLANDLLASGVQLAGGGARLDGLDGCLANELGLEVHVEEPELLAVRGASRCLEELGAFEALSAASRR